MRKKLELQPNVFERNGDDITEDLFLGLGPFARVAEQSQMPLEAFRKVNQIAIGAWRSLPSDKEKTSLSNVKQGSDEKYEDLVSRLVTAVGRSINNEVSEVLIKQLAFKNANSTCQTLLRPMKNSGNVTDYVKQCADACLYVSPAFITRGVYRSGLKRENV